MTIQTTNLTIPERKPRRYLADGFKVGTWETLQPYFDELKTRDINTVEELEKWMQDRSELECVLS